MLASYQYPGNFWRNQTCVWRFFSFWRIAPIWGDPRKHSISGALHLRGHKRSIQRNFCWFIAVINEIKYFPTSQNKRRGLLLCTASWLKSEKYIHTIYSLDLLLSRLCWLRWISPLQYIKIRWYTFMVYLASRNDAYKQVKHVKQPAIACNWVLPTWH